MKKILFLVAILALTISVQATITYNYTYTLPANTVIPDGSPVGLAESTTLSGLADGGINLIGNVDVRLTINGGYNGDLYGYLVLQSADGSITTSILLNRVGRNATADYGSATAGFGSITLSGNTGTDIHLATGTTDGGTYLADGRTLNPNGDFTGANGTLGTAGLDILNNHDANGTWTLFLADMAGGEQSTLVSWGLDITVVPEPVTWALMAFCCVIVMLLLVQQRAIIGDLTEKITSRLRMV